MVVRIFDTPWLMHGVAEQMRRKAIQSRTYDGIATAANMVLLQSCTAQHAATGSTLIFTRDSGMHSSGWWKNPDYERCWHLSLSFRDPLTGEHIDHDHKVAGRWIEAFYGEDSRYVWAEPPYSDHGKTAATWHYRVFCNPAWEPILPRGEVYSKEFTERGWLSFSDLQSAKHLALDALPGEQ